MKPLVEFMLHKRVVRPVDPIHDPVVGSHEAGMDPMPLAAPPPRISPASRAVRLAEPDTLRSSGASGSALGMPGDEERAGDDSSR